MGNKGGTCERGGGRGYLASVSSENEAISWEDGYHETHIVLVRFRCAVHHAGHGGRRIAPGVGLVFIEELKGKTVEVELITVF